MANKFKNCKSCRYNYYKITDKPCNICDGKNEFKPVIISKIIIQDEYKK